MGALALQTFCLTPETAKVAAHLAPLPYSTGCTGHTGLTKNSLKQLGTYLNGVLQPKHVLESLERPATTQTVGFHLRIQSQ